MSRAGFEGDKQRIMLYNRNLKIETDLTTSIDLSAAEIIWSQDSKYIYFTAANTIYTSIYKIDVSSKELFTITEEVDASSITLSPSGDKIFLKIKDQIYLMKFFQLKLTVKI